MARMPQTSSSSATLIEKGRRVCRLCDRVGNGSQKYAALILEAEKELTGIIENVRPRTFERIAAYDAAVLADTQLDDAVRDAFHACRKYDCSFEGVPVMEKVFPGAVFTPIVQASREQELERVTRVIARLSSLATEGGTLAGIAAELDEALKRSAEAQETLEKSILEESRFTALEKLGKKEYVEKYGAVYHKACGELGRAKANKLFPGMRLKRKRMPENQAAPAQTESESA